MNVGQLIINYLYLFLDLKKNENQEYTMLEDMVYSNL